MPLEEDDQARVDAAEDRARAGGSNQIVVRSPSDAHKMGPVTVACMIFNRTIGKSQRPNITGIPNQQIRCRVWYFRNASYYAKSHWQYRPFASAMVSRVSGEHLWPACMARVGPFCTAI